MNNIWIFVCVSLIEILLELSNGQSSDMVFFKHRDYYDYLYCAAPHTTNESALIYMNTNYGSVDYLKVPGNGNNYICPVIKSDSCVRNKFIPNGIFTSTLEKFGGIVLDKRWEDFQEIKTKGQSVKIFAEISTDNFAFAFSIRIEENGYLYICDLDTPWDAKNCYFIVLGGWGKKKIGLRRCVQDQLFKSLDKYPMGSCAPLRSEFIRSKIVAKDKWTHFVIKKTFNEISLYHYGETAPLVSFYDNNPFKPTHVTIRSPDYGYWKLHDYNFFAVNDRQTVSTDFSVSSAKVCIKVYIKPCSGCNINLSLQVNWDKRTITSEVTSKENEWQSIILRSEENFKSNLLQLNIIADGIGSEPYLIGDIINCASNDLSVIKMYFEESICCHSIKHETKICAGNLNSRPNIKEDADNACPVNTFGKSCTSCKLFNNCEQSAKYCEATFSSVQCSCYDGYIGYNCDKSCEKGYYGKACKKQCHVGCDGCDTVSGKCSTCKEYISKPANNCTTLLYPVLTTKPEIISVGHNNVSIRINFDYHGETAPDFYEIQMNHNKRWDTFGRYNYRDSTIKTVDNLLSNTTYNVRIILLTSRRDKEERSEFIQTQEFITTCRDITKDDISFSVQGMLMIISFVGSAELCPIKDLVIDNGIYNIYNQHNQSVFYEKCKNYTITVFKKGIKWFNFDIRTGEDNVDIACPIWDFTDTDGTIAWNKYRDVTSYTVSYEYLGSMYKNCQTSKSSKQKVEVQKPEVYINGLIPYSQYEIVIENEENKVSRKIAFETQSRATISFDELEEVSWTQSESYLTIPLAINCKNVKGPLSGTVQLQCISDWCSKDNVASASFNLGIRKNRDLSQFDVYGLAEYKIEIRLNRSESSDVKHYQLITNSTASGPVLDLAIYSKTEQALSLRWKPPYPPMGHLSRYEVELLVSKWNGWKNLPGKSVDISTCEFWKDYHCVSFENLNSNTYYTVMVVPINDDKLYGATNSVQGTTRQEAPNPPNNLELIWSENNEELLTRFPHPDITNGPLTYFHVYLDRRIIKRVSIEKENATYSYLISKFPTAKEITLSVRVINGAGESRFITNTTFTPPPIPDVNIDNIDIVANFTNVTLELPKITSTQGDIVCSIAVIVTKISSTSVHAMDAENRKIIEEGKVPSNSASWVAWKKDNISQNEKMTLHIGDDDSTNRALLPNTEYKITVLIKNSYRDKTKSLIWAKDIKTLALEGGDSNMLLLLILLIIPGLCACVFILRSRGIRLNVPKINYSRTRHPSNETANLVLQPVQPVRLKPKPAIYQNVEEVLKDSEFSRPVKLAELESYIKDSLASGEFDRQHALFPRGQTKPWAFGTKPENKSKNRYVNLAAYDHSRVRLDVIHKDPNSEYINANYIDGYNCQRAFIATQGPKINTLDDFWRMIWQEQVEYIVMIANLVEGGKKKVAKYWPEINETLSFGEVSVKYMSVTVFANHEERIFTATCQGEHRSIKQLHFTSWPDHGVPMYAQSLAPFLKKVLTVPQDTAPIVVHCSAGVGRTGTLILADICLRMAAKEGAVDVLYHQHKIREQRPNMVDNVEQYKLVHLLLLHCLVAPETSIICTENMDMIVEELLASKEVLNQMKYLEENSWQDETMHTSATKVSLPIVYEKNRFRNIVPDEYSRIILTAYPPTDETSMYINAIKVDGFQASGKFVVTQYPLSNTVGDFWRLILEQEITIAICLNELHLDDEISGTFFPSQSDTPLIPVPYLNIDLISVEEDIMFNTYMLNVKNTKKKGESFKFTLIHLKNWNYDQICPENPMPLVTLFEEMNRIGKHTERILISCYDGVRASGLYTALCFLIEEIKLEQICDVCLAVRTVRHSRKEFVREVEQFRFLYLCGLEYVKTFAMYSNFKV